MLQKKNQILLLQFCSLLVNQSGWCSPEKDCCWLWPVCGVSYNRLKLNITSTQVVETLVTLTTNNSPQDYANSDNKLTTNIDSQVWVQILHCIVLQSSWNISKGWLGVVSTLGAILCLMLRCVLGAWACYSLSRRIDSNMLHLELFEKVLNSICSEDCM